MKKPKNEYRVRMESLIERSGMNQAKLAEKIGVAHSLVSLVVKGKREPSTSLSVSLGNVAAEFQLYEEAEWFWQQAGIKFQGMVQTTLALLKHHEAPITRGLMTIVPPNKLLKQESAKDRLLYFPTYLLPDPLACSFVVADDDVLRPLANRRDVLIIDESETDVWNMVGSYVAAFRVTSWNKHVLANRSKLTEEEMEQLLSLRPSRSGLYAGWLRSSIRDGKTVITLESPNILGGTSSEVVAVQFRRERSDVPEFVVLGSIVSLTDMRGKALPLYEVTPKGEDRNRK
jgi:transcriptional regulator with XRE-family HTH domain